MVHLIETAIPFLPPLCHKNTGYRTKCETSTIFHRFIWEIFPNDEAPFGNFGMIVSLFWLFFCLSVKATKLGDGTRRTLKVKAPKAVQGCLSVSNNSFYSLHVGVESRYFVSWSKLGLTCTKEDAVEDRGFPC